jgi:hypothetical protein
MKKEHIPIWEKIAAFKLDDPEASRPFSKKFQEENVWTEEKTIRTIAEYKKFLFLCATLPNGASPSPTVDIAWHLHLTYTDSYWNKLCDQTLGFPLHHHPSKGGNGEAQKHHQWYQNTLIAYVEAFGHIPPDDIWTYPFSFDPAYYLPKKSPFLIETKENTDGTSRDTREGVVIEGSDTIWGFKVTIFENIAKILIVSLIAVLIFPSILKGTLFLIPLAALAFCIIALIIHHGKQNRHYLNVDIQNLSPDLSPYIGAWIMGKNERFLTTMLYEATSKCSINQNSKRFTFTLKNDEKLYLNPLFTVLQTVENQDISIDLVKETLNPHIELVKRQVKAKQYENRALPTYVMTLIAICFGIAITRFIEGLYFDKPVLFLFMSMVVMGLSFIITYSAFEVDFKDWRDSIYNRFQPQYASSGVNDIWVFALGAAVFALNDNWYAFEQSLIPPHARNNGSDGSSGCSGSSCSGDGGGGDGGGCGGGCGGCGS